MKRKPYRTDLSDEQWEIIQALLPEPKSRTGRGRKQSVDRREIINAYIGVEAVVHGNCCPMIFPQLKRYIAISANGTNREYGSKFTLTYDNRCAKSIIEKNRLVQESLTANR